MADRKEDLLQQRLAKLGRIRAQGIDPYPTTYRRTCTNQEALGAFLLREDSPDAIGAPPVKLAGRITSHRPMGKATFMDLRDGSAKIQLYFKRDTLGADKYAMLKELDLGDIIGVTGRTFRTHTGEITLDASDFTILCKALQPPPEKWHGLTDVEKRYRQRYVDLISNEDVRRIFLLRSQLVAAVRRFLDARGFMETETPVLQSTAGGALARPFITHHNALDRDFYLRIATELHLKRLLIGGFDKVYELGRIFRNEGISTKHNPEFTSLETYEAYADYRDVMAMVEEMVSCVARDVLGTLQVAYNGSTIDFTPPWHRMTLRDAIIRYSGVDFEDYPDADSLRRKTHEIGVRADERAGRGKLIDELLSTFVEPNLVQPTFLLDYPVELSPLAKRKPDNPRLVERFEGFAGGIEIANAFTELNDPQDQRERFAEQLRRREAGDEEAEMPDEDFLLALEYGMPPAGGLGVGIDRLVMLLTDQQSIREVILFPQLRSKE
ncbi:MAG: lysine--tRNA ligase [Chloroflexi bacterium]|nr:lysine--tRNA ligase [Chloroflexota bacterium]